MEEKKTFLPFGGLWKRTSKKGEDYLSGSMNGLSLMIFKNKEKKNDKSPDYYMSLAKYEKKEETVEEKEESPF